MKHQKHSQNLPSSAEQHHGDLRKGAYLKRRAAYRMQAGDPAGPHAGALTSKIKGNP